MKITGNAKLRKELNEYKGLYRSQRIINTEYIDLVYKKNEEIEKLQIENEKLKSMTGLSDEEVREIVKSAKSINNLGNITKIYSNYFPI